MKIVYWSDFVCPFCYIGEARLKRAIREMGLEDKVSIELKAFQLDPNAGVKAEGDTVTRFAHKYGLTKAEAARRIDDISQMGIEEGLDFKYATTLFTNTMDAHRLVKLAQTKGEAVADKLIESLYNAYFTENLELADHDLLKKLGVEAGLTSDEVEKLLNSDDYHDDVILDEREAARYGIYSVPFFAVAGKYGISGAQSVEAMKATLKKAMEDEKAEPETAHGMSCGPDGCGIR